MGLALTEARQTVTPVKQEMGGLVRCGGSGIELRRCGRCSLRKGSGMIASRAPGVLSAWRFSTVVSSSVAREAETWQMRPWVEGRSEGAGEGKYGQLKRALHQLPWCLMNREGNTT